MDIIGQTLLERYRIDDYLGGGAMADVYKVWDNFRSCWLAVKILRPNLAQSAEFVERLKREANVLEKLNHPNVVRFYGIEQSPTLTFLVMQLVDGSTLAARLDDAGGPLPVHEVVSIVRDLCPALAYAHRMNVIHRDIKPGNILFTAEGRALLSDFSISQLEESPTITQFPIGTPAYMSPEQCAGTRLGPSSDLYSLGIVIYEMLTGRRPFRGETSPLEPGGARAVQYEQVHSPPVPLRDLNADVNQALERVVMRTLAKLPQYRYQTAEELAAAVDEAVAVDVGLPPLAVEAPPGAEVFVDGRRVGRSSTTVTGIAQGEHRIEIALEGYERYVRQITFPETRSLQPVLVASPHPITVLQDDNPATGEATTDIDTLGTPPSPSTPATSRLSFFKRTRWLIAAAAAATAIAAVVVPLMILGTIGVLPDGKSGPPKETAGPVGLDQTAIVSGAQAFDVLATATLQDADLPAGLKRSSSGFFSANELIGSSVDPETTQRRLQSWGFVFGHFREYRTEASAGLFDVLVTLWLLQDESHATSSFVAGAMVTDFPGINEAEAASFPSYGDESIAFVLSGSAPDSTGAPIQAQGYSVVMRVGRLSALLTTLAPVGTDIEQATAGLLMSLAAHMSSFRQQ